MSTEGCVCGCSGTAPAPAQEDLPVDLLLEIIALADVATVVRFAATGKILRRAILDPAFRRRLALAAGDGFDPALLLAVSYRERPYSGNVTTHHLIHTPEPTKLRARLDGHSLPDSFKPVASRDGLLVLRHGERPYDKVELRACDTFTGHVTSLPRTTLPNAYFDVVLSVGVADGDARRSFELLVADMNIRFHRTFSSKDSQWSAMRVVAVPLPNLRCDSDRPAVVGRTVYLPRKAHDFSQYWDHILALDADAAKATMMVLPPGLFSRNQLLLARVRNRLCILVKEARRIAMWTLTSSLAATETAKWTRQVVISNLEILRQARLQGAYSVPLWTSTLEGFGERSGAVILNLFNKGYLLRLDLGIIKEGKPVITWLSIREKEVCVKDLFLHEIDLISLLQAMKYF